MYGDFLHYSKPLLLYPGMRHYLGIMMPPQESDDWSYDLFTRRLVAHMQSSDDWAQEIVQRSLILIMVFSVRGLPFSTSAEISGFRTPSPLTRNSRNLPY